MADNNTLPEPKLRTEKYLNAIANNTAGGGGETAIIKKSKTITANGTYSALNEDFDGYEQVIANVPNSFTPADEGKVVSQGALVSQSSTAANQNGTVDTTLYNSIDIDVPNTYTAGDEGKVVDNGHLVAQTSTSALQNGTINTTTNNEVVVNVPNTYVAADEGKVVSNGGLVSQTSTNINTNGTVNTTLNNEVVVAVPNTYTAGDEGKVVSNGALVGQTSTNILSNGTVDTTLNNEVVVAVPNTYAAGDEGKVVSNGALVGQTATSITTNNTTVDTTLNNKVSVNITVPQPTLITKNIVLNGTYNASSDSADGYSSVDVQVPNTYAAADEGKVVSSGALVSQTAYPSTVTVNDTYDTTNYNSITVNVNVEPTSVNPKDVNFYDYDGTIVNSYTATEFAELSAMPANPTHEGLTAQGWNWSLADAKAYVADYGSLNIGQMYITSDGKTRIYISLPEGRTSPILQLYLNANSELDIDWGDGSTHSTFTSTTAGYKSERHEYSTSGDYVIAITVVNGGFAFQSSSTNVSSTLWDGNNSGNSPDRAYNNAIKKIEIGDTVTSISSNAFQYCYSLSSITIPDGVTSIGGNAAFRGCYSLSSITIPDGVTSIGINVFNSCYALSSITIPDGVTSIGGNAFSSCYLLSSITIPDGVTSIGSNAFQYCYSLSSITIPDGVTSIGGNAFASCSSLSSITIPDGVTSIGDKAFAGCSSLSSITIPNGVTSIGDKAFQNCSYMSYIKFESTTPPTVAASSAWSNVSTSTKILVPTGTLETYKTATNYPNPSTYTYEEY